MGTIANKLSLLSQTKSAIKTAIINKGQEVLDSDPFSSYASKIEAIQGGGGEYDPTDPESVYKATRPSDWLPMPEPNDDELYLLFHIPDGVSSLLAFTTTCTGQYTVSLGTVTNGSFVSQSSVQVNSGTKYETELFAEDYGNLTSDGLKQVMVKVSGTAILTWKQSAHTKRTGFSNWNIVEIKGKLPSATNVNVGSPSDTLTLQKLKYFRLIGTSSVTNMNNMFYKCHSLAAIPQLDTSSVTNMSSMFYECYSLAAIPQLDTSSVTNMSAMFYNCYSLAAIPQLDTSSVTNMGSMFYECHSLAAIPQLDTSSVTNMNNVFRNCYSLAAIPQLDTSSVTNMNNMFYNCYSLTKLTLNPTVAGWAGYAFSLLNCALGHQAIVDFFNSLPTITSAKAITLTGNPGVPELTDADKLIATEKGWTLTL